MVVSASFERSDTPEKIRTREKTDEDPYVDTQAFESVYVQVLKIALEAVKSRINRRDQEAKSFKGMVRWL